MKVFKRSKAYGALEYTLIIALLIVIAILILNFIKNRTHGFTWMDSASDKVSEYVGGSSPSGPGDPGGTPVGSNIELYFPAAKPVFDIKEGETLTKEQIKQYITDNNGVVRNKTTLAEISVYEIEDITYNPFDPSVYIQFKVTSLEGDAVSQIPGNILAELADGCVLATDADFSGTTDGDFKYIGSATCVKIPHVIKGVNVTSYKYMFISTNVKKVISDNLNIINMGGMFWESTSTTLDLSNLNTSNVTDMSYMFSLSKATSLDLSNFDTSKVTNMSGMFASSQATSLDLPSFNTSNVTNMSSMFAYSQAISLDLSSFDTSNVTDMSWMFAGSQTITLDLSSFNTENVTNMSYMFSESQAMTLDLSNFNTSNVTTMSYMFQSSQATTLNLSSFDTENVANMSYMFDNSQATTLDLSSFDTSNVTNMSYMFDNSQATTLDLSSFDTSKVTNMRCMFRSSKTTTLDLSSFNFTKAVVNDIFQFAQTTSVLVKDTTSQTKLNGSSNRPAHTIISIK